MTNEEKLEAIRALIDEEFDHPLLESLGLGYEGYGDRDEVIRLILEGEVEDE